MEETTVKKGGLSGAFLKHLAFFAMLANHFCNVVLAMKTVTPPGWTAMHWYLTRFSMPVFAFLIAEGMRRTRSRKKLMLRLLLTALASEVIYDFCFYGSFFYKGDQNVFFALFAGTVAIQLYDRVKEDPLTFAAGTAALLCAGYLLKCSYGVAAVLVILAAYAHREKSRQLFSIGVLLLVCPFLTRLRVLCPNGTIIPSFFGNYLTFALTDALAITALPLLALYNGKRGRQLPKYFYYAFYPAHLIVLTVLRALFRS